jgi:hypothetical protein
VRNAAALALFLFAGAAAAQAPLVLAQAMMISRVDLHQCGIYENRVESREDDAQSASGKRTIVTDNRLVQETLNIPAKVGVKFGCLVVPQGAPPGQTANFLVVMRLPAGSQRKQLSGSQSYVIGEGGHVGYTFRTPESVLRGPWTLEIWVAERKLAEKRFFVGD